MRQYHHDYYDNILLSHVMETGNYLLQPLFWNLYVVPRRGNCS